MVVGCLLLAAPRCLLDHPPPSTQLLVAGGEMGGLCTGFCVSIASEDGDQCTTVGPGCVLFDLLQRLQLLRPPAPAAAAAATGGRGGAGPSISSAGGGVSIPAASC